MTSLSILGTLTDMSDYQMQAEQEMWDAIVESDQQRVEMEQIEEDNQMWSDAVAANLEEEGGL